MRQAFLLGWKDCLVRFQSRTVLMFVIALPLAMTIVTGFAFKGLEPGSIEAKLALVVEDPEVPDEVRQALAELRTWPPRSREPAEVGSQAVAPVGAQLKVVSDLNAEEARRLVAEEELDGAIVLPRGFSQQVQAGDDARLELVLGANPTLQSSMVEAASDWFVQRLRQRQQRPLSVAHSTVGERQRLVGFNSFSQAVAGNGVMFILMNCMTMGGAALVRERRQNTLARLMISPMTPRTIVLGKTLGVYFVGLVQAIVLFGFGAIIGVLTGVDVLGVILITLLLILVGCALGLLISSLARREETVEALGSPIALVMTALGGGMFPVEMAPQWLQRISFSLPTGWAMDGYHDLIWFGKGVADILPNLAVLAAFAAVFLLMGIWKLRWE